MNERQIEEEDLKRYAVEDAILDGTDDQFQHFNNRLKYLVQMVNEKDVEKTVDEFRNWADKTEQKIEDWEKNIPNPQREATQLETEMQMHLNKVENQLSHKIRQQQKEMSRWQQRFGESLQTHVSEPEKKNIVWLSGIILILLAVESIANSRFFAETSDLGLLGGTLAAITVSFGNVFVPLILAFFAHRWFYRPNVFRNVGIGMIVLFFVWVVGFNYLVAEYREGLLLQVGKSLNTLDYVLLFSLGVIVGVISFWKMWTFHDPYYEARKCANNLKETMDNFCDTALEPLTRRHKQYGDQTSEINAGKRGINTRLENTSIDFDAVHAKAIQDANSVIAIYYRHYCIRKVDPDPPYPDVITPDNASQFGVGVQATHRNLFESRKTRFNKFIHEEMPIWIEKLEDVFHKIENLIKRFRETILNMLNELNLASKSGVNST